MCSLLCLIASLLIAWTSNPNDQQGAAPQRPPSLPAPSVPAAACPQSHRPTITVLESDADYSDIMMQVREVTSGSLLFGAQVNGDAGLCGTVTGP